MINIASPPPYHQNHSTIILEVDRSFSGDLFSVGQRLRANWEKFKEWTAQCLQISCSRIKNQFFFSLRWLFFLELGWNDWLNSRVLRLSPGCPLVKWDVIKFLLWVELSRDELNRWLVYRRIILALATCVYEVAESWFFHLQFWTRWRRCWNSADFCWKYEQISVLIPQFKGFAELSLPRSQ